MDTVDHINRVRSDNRWDNLRAATRKQNGRNHGIYANNTSGVMGVVWNKARRKWQAQIEVEGKNHHLGLYMDFESAVESRREAEVRHFGSFAGVLS